ncbi:MAG: class I SAM-dependent methyltransferase [Nitrospinota bacterium]
MKYTCRICDTSLEPFMSFGKMPIANGFLTPDDFASEYFFELKPGFCENCSTLQILVQPDPEKMFHENYAFFSRTSKRMAIHFNSYAEWVKKNYLKSDDPFVVEIGSNDGLMMECFAKDRIRQLGVEPSANVAEKARGHGVETLCSFFNLEAAKKIVSEKGHADALIAANVMCHIPDLHEVAKGADHLLTPGGVLIFEEPYLGDMVENTAYDQIYDEHVYIFSARSVLNIFNRYNFDLVDVKPQTTHGGSMRYVLARRDKWPVSSAVTNQLQYEEEKGLHLGSTYDLFREKCESSRENLVKILKEQKDAGRRIVGYAATSKSTTVLNYCNIGPDLIEFISDTTPIKQGKFSPGMHIPVRAYETLLDGYPDGFLLFAWNHKAEVFEKELAFTESGGEWITYVPQVEIIRK